MKPVLAFVVGALMSGAIVVFWPRADPQDLEVERWRVRAERAENELAAERRKTAALATQMRGLAERFDALAARLETLSAAAAEAFRSPDAQAAKDPGDAAAPPAAPTPEFQPVPEEQWDALVSGALESDIERRLGTAASPERVTRLRDSLRQVRDAARKLEEPGEDDPERARRDLERNIALMQADRAFREELGIGVAEFLRGLDPGQLEEVPR